MILFRHAFYVLLTIAALLRADSVVAHVEEDMPDPVKEMEYRILLEFEPDNMVVRNKLGMIYVRKGNFDDAEAQFSRILKVKPSDFDALDAMGLIMNGRKRFDDAIRYFRDAIQIKSRDALVHYHLGVALENKGALADAEAAYGMALELSPKMENKNRQQAEEMKKIEEALRNLREKKPSIP